MNLRFGKICIRVSVHAYVPMHICMHIYLYMCVYTHVFSMSPEKSKKNAPVAVSTSSIQILVSNTIFH